MCELHHILISNLLLFCLAVRLSLKQCDDKHEQKWIKGTSYSVSLAMHHAWRTEFCEGWFSPTDMNYFPSENGRTGRRSERESTKPTWNCQLFPDEASFRSLSGQWEPLIISVRTIQRNSGSAEITMSQSIKITTPQRGEHVKSNHHSLDSDSYPNNFVRSLVRKSKKKKKNTKINKTHSLFQKHPQLHLYLIKGQIQKSG